MKAEARTVSQRKPIASEMAVVRGTPRMARLATASSHSTSVRTVDAANTTAYCWRNLVLVKSTLAVSFTASLSLSTVQEAASAQPLAREDRGSRVEVGLVTEPEPAPPCSPSQIFLASPKSRAQSELPVVGEADGEGVGDGVGSAYAWDARSTAVVCTAVSAPAILSTR